MPAPIVISHFAIQRPPPAWVPTLEAAEKAAKTQPDARKAQLNLGLAYYRVERYREAITTLKRVAIKFPKSPQTHYWLGCAYMGANDLVRALQTFEYLTQIPHVSTGYLLNTYIDMEHCYFDLYQDQKAELVLQKALKIDKNNQDVRDLLKTLHEEMAIRKKQGW